MRLDLATHAPANPSFDRTARTSFAVALGICVVSIAVFLRLGLAGEPLLFGLFTMGTLAGLRFPWGWRTQLPVVLTVLAPLGLASPWMRYALRPIELVPIAVTGVLLSVAIAEASARSFRAVHARRQSEEAALRELAASRDTYRNLAENARDVIWTADLEGRLTYINDAGARILGSTPADLIGQSPDRYVTDHPANSTPTAMRGHLKAGGTLPPTVLQWRTVTGNAWVEVVAHALRDADGKVIGFHGISRDVTERIRTEEALRASEARYRGLVESQEALIYRADPAGNLTFLNEACRRKYGVEHVPLSELNFLTFVHPDDVAQARAALQMVVNGGRYRRASRGRCPEGWRWIEWEVCAITDGAGVVTEVQGVGHDVTEQRAADEALQRTLGALREREEQLRLMGLQQVAIREEERKRLSFDLHDGVCQELVGIGILLESARQRGVSEAASSTLVRAQSHLRTVAEHLRMMARDLRPLQLSDLGLGECLRALATGMTTNGVRVAVDVAPTIPRFGEEIEVAVYRVAQEALANAIRHAHAHVITLTLATANGTLALEVRDDGRGFDRQELRAAALGLVAMEERAVALGGSLHVHSAPGAGTTVRLECPLSAA